MDPSLQAQQPIGTGTPDDPVNRDHGQEAHVVYFRKHGVQPPAGVYVERDDLIRVTFVVNDAATTESLSLRWLSPDGDIVPEQFTIQVPAFNQTPFVNTFDHAE